MSATKPAEDAAALRRIVVFGVLFSTLTTVFFVVYIPIVYSQLQRVQTDMSEELDFCKMRSENIHKEIAKTQVSFSSFLILRNLHSTELA